MRDILAVKPLLVLGFALPTVACNEIVPEQDERPNVILIMADDLGWGDVGFNGNELIKTPHLDEMAADGLRLSRFYSACAVSSPTRASVLTGRSPYRTGIFSANVGILRPEEVTLPEILSEAGYATGHFGKWHLGSLTHTEKDSNRGDVGNLKDFNPPKMHGYQEAFVSDSKVPTWDPMKLPVEFDVAAGENKKDFWSSLDQGEPFLSYGTAYWDIDGEKVTENLDGDDSRVIMDRVLPFIGRQVQQDRKFFTVIWFHAPHKPCVAGAEYRAIYSDQDPAMQNYAGCITAMDEQIGRLRAYLAELGVDKNTMIWFCSDNGPEDRGPGETGGFAERKRSLHEGGVRVPGIMLWPALGGDIKECAIPAVTYDYMPTILAAVGVDPSEMKHEVDGENLLPILRGEVTQRERPIVLCFNNQLSISDNTNKIYRRGDATYHYDIVDDPYEQEPHELSSSHRTLLEEMNRVVDSFKASFMGEEYGHDSYERMGQRWRDPRDVD